MHPDVEGFKEIVFRNCDHLDLPPPPDCIRCNKIVEELSVGFTAKVHAAARQLIADMDKQ